MKRVAILGLVLAACCAAQALGRQGDLHGTHGARRSLHQSAVAGATGSQSSSAYASASNVNGKESAQTSSSATGAGSTTFGVSQAAGQIDTCFNGPNYNASQCRTLAPSIRATNCTDIPPDDIYTCQQQAVDYKKCDFDFMYLGSYCLKACNRCGESCYDMKPADGSACDSTKCDTDVYKASPICLETCGRCSTTA